LGPGGPIAMGICSIAVPVGSGIIIEKITKYYTS